jgi:hypothetical protein
MASAIRAGKSAHLASPSARRTRIFPTVPCAPSEQPIERTVDGGEPAVKSTLTTLLERCRPGNPIGHPAPAPLEQDQPGTSLRVHGAADYPRPRIPEHSGISALSLRTRSGSAATAIVLAC